MAVTISVIENKIRVTTAESGVDAVITKFSIVDGALTQTSTVTLENISVYSETAELEDGIYQIDTNDTNTETNIAFVINNIEEEKSIFELDAIKTRPQTIQVNNNRYYDLLCFSIQYDNLIAAIANYNTNGTVPFTNIEVVSYFDNISNYFKQ